VVPIHASPKFSSSQFPKFIDFSLVPLGERYVAVSNISFKKLFTT